MKDKRLLAVLVLVALALVAFFRWMPANGYSQPTVPSEAGASNGEQKSRTRPPTKADAPTREPSERDSSLPDTQSSKTSPPTQATSGDQSAPALLTLRVMTQLGSNVIEGSFGSPAPGTVRVVSVDGDGGAPQEWQQETEGETTFEGLLRERYYDVEFTPRSNLLLPARRRFGPTSYSGTEAEQTVRMTANGKPMPRVKFGEEREAGYRAYIQVRAAEGEGKVITRMNLEDGQRLYSINHSTIEPISFRWIERGRLGAPIVATLEELIKQENVTIHPPMPAPGISVYLVDESGNPVPGKSFRFILQGTAHQQLEVVSDEFGVIALPEWDREVFTIASLSPRQVNSTKPHTLSNPKDGDRLVFVGDHLVVLATIAGIAHNDSRINSTRASLWVPPTSSAKDQQLASKVNLAGGLLVSSGDSGVQIAVSPLTANQFADPSKARLVINLSDQTIADLPLFAADGSLASDQQVAAPSSFGRTRKWSFVESDLPTRSEWKMYPGRPMLSAVVQAVLADQLPEGWFVYRPSGDQRPPAQLQYRPFIVTALASDGTLCIADLTWGSGEQATLKVRETYPGANANLWTSGEYPNAGINASYYDLEKDTGYLAEGLWNSGARMVEVGSDGLQLSIPAGTAIVVYPMLNNGLGKLSRPYTRYLWVVEGQMQIPITGR